MQVPVRAFESIDFKLTNDERYYSNNREFYLMFENDSNLVVRNSNENVIIWETSTSSNNNPAYQGSTCILHSDGNIVIYNNYNSPIWHSVRAPLEVCVGHCINDSSCSIGLLCYQQGEADLDRRFLMAITDPSSQPSLSGEPSEEPSNQPSLSGAPSEEPSSQPSLSGVPSEEPSNQPSLSGAPSKEPSSQPSLSGAPSEEPSNQPSLSGLPSNVVRMTL